MKKIAIALLLLIGLVLLTGCEENRVRISRNSAYIENIVLPLRHGYQFAEDVYSIRETNKGYDIVVHAERIPEAADVQDK